MRLSPEEGFTSTGSGTEYNSPGWHHTFDWDGGWELADFVYYFTFGARGSLPDTRVPHSTHAHSAEADVARTKRPKASGTVQRSA